MSKSVQQWFNDLNDTHKPVLLELRQLILSIDPNFREDLKWGQPCYSLNALTCYLAKAASHVNLGFQQGAHISDPEQYLRGSGKNMRHMQFKLDDTINAEIVRSMIKAAIEVDFQQAN